MKESWQGEAEKRIKELLGFLGENPERDGLKNTPARVVRSWQELYSGLKVKEKDIEKMLTQFDGGEYDELVLLKHVPFDSICEHHLMGFSGVAHIGYIPTKNVVGISKLARLLEIYSRRPQIQERITWQVTNALMKHLEPQAAGCILEATHSCISCRGVKKQGCKMVTSCLRGSFKTDDIARAEFLRLIKL